MKLEHFEKRSRLRCQVCDKMFDNMYSLYVHLQSHDEGVDSQQHKCEFCEKSYKTASSLKIHVAYHHDFDKDKIFTCQTCGMMFPRRDRLSAHLETHKPLNEKRSLMTSNLARCSHFAPNMKYSFYEPLSCKDCTGFICKFCLYVFSTKRRFIAHTHTNYCGTCGVKYLDKKFYDFHMAFHEDPDSPFGCRICRFKFSTATGLRIHSNKVHSDINDSEKAENEEGAEPLGSSDSVKKLNKSSSVVPMKTSCSKSVPNTELFSNTNKHSSEIEVKSRKKEKSNVTVASGGTNENESVLKRRGPKKGPPKLHFCSHCDKEFKRNWDLKRHMKTMHSTDPAVETFKCDICEKTVKSKRNLKLHMKTHGNSQSSYACKVCDKTFVHQNYLNVHMNIHVGNKNFSCPICFKTYLKAQGLEEHMTSHSQMSAYKCGICQKPFASKSSLKKHTDKLLCGVRKVQNRKEIDTYKTADPNRPKRKVRFACPSP